MKIQFSLFIILLFLLNKATASNNPETREIYVSDTGTNTLACLNGTSTNPCHSLLYVLTNLNNFDDNRIVLLSNQLIASYTDDTQINGNVSITSIGNVVIKIYCCWYVIGTNDQSLRFSNLTLFITNSFAIKNFCSVTFYNVVLNNWTSSFVIISEVATLVFENLHVFNISTNTSSIHVMYVGTVLFHNCVFEDSQVMGKTITNSLINIIETSVASFQSCWFQDNTVSSDAALLLISVRMQNQVTISNCTFIENKINGLYTADASLIYVTQTNGSFRIEQSHFLYNEAVHDPIVVKPAVAIYFENVALNTSFKDVTFVGNNMALIKGEIQSMQNNNYDIFTLSFLNLEILKNTANWHLISFQPQRVKKQPSFMIVKIGNLSVTSNSISIAYQEKQNFILYFEGDKIGSTVYLSSSEFVDNTATPFKIDGMALEFSGNILFESNSALNGGGIYLDGAIASTLGGNGNITLLNNNARYGGAVYISVCPSVRLDSDLTFNFSGNTANNYFSGPNIYLHNDDCSCNFQKFVTIYADNKSMILTSYPTIIEASDTLHIYPGKEIVLQMNVTNECNTENLACSAYVYLVCNGTLCNPVNELLLSASSASSLYIYSADMIRTGLKIAAPSKDYIIQINNESIQLLFLCPNPSQILGITTGSVDVILTKCPIGMKFENNVCKCPNPSDDSFFCSASSGIACTKKGFWAGLDKNDNFIVQSCSSKLYCRNKGEPCSSQLTTEGRLNYIQLNLSDDGINDQCKDGHGGTLCMYCSENKVFTYLAIRCIPQDECDRWHPWVLFVVTLSLSFFIGAALIVIVRTKFEIGSGYLYGPILYLAALSQVLPNTADTNLLQIVKLYTTLYLLQYEILGYAPLCFLPSFNPLYSISLQFLNPFIFSIILFSTYILAKYFPRKFLRLQPYPVQSMSILLLVSYWSLAKTSIQILQYVELVTEDGNTSTIVPLFHPNIGFFTKGHIPLVIIAVIVLIVLAVYLILMMLSQCISFYRLKPFLDEFQSCYQDKYRWYSVVYALSMVAMAPVTISSYSFIAEAIIISATLAQCILQPYRKKWLNVVDTMLLIDLTFIIFLKKSDDSAYNVVILILTIIPLIYILLGTILLLLYGTNLHHKLLNSRPVTLLVDGMCTVRDRLVISYKNVNNSPARQPLNQQFPPVDDYFEREPLIGIIQDS